MFLRATTRKKGGKGQPVGVSSRIDGGFGSRAVAATPRRVSG